MNRIAKNILLARSMPIPTCCHVCANYIHATAVLVNNLARRGVGSLEADKKTGCPPRNSPCAAKPWKKGCAKSACGHCEGFRRK